MPHNRHGSLGTAGVLSVFIRGVFWQDIFKVSFCVYCAVSYLAMDLWLSQLYCVCDLLQTTCMC